MTTSKTSMKGFPDRSLELHLPALSSVNLAGKRMLIVGGTDGLGRAFARAAAGRGAEVTVVGRTFRDEGTPRISFVRADLSSMKEALRLGETLPAEQLDVVVLTTGIFAAKTREATSEGVERDLAISYLSRFALIRGPAPRLGRGRAAGSPAPRVFVMGFPGTGQLGDPSDLNAERAYDPMAVHMNTVAGNEALVLDGAQRWPEVKFFGLNPGLIKTNIRANYLGEGSLTHRLAEFFIGLLMQTPESYAERLVPLLLAPELEGRTGLMFGAKANPILPTEGFDAAHVGRFVAASEALVAKAVSS
jgi:NAD(P)-dependent dehydrogenase (short-subunit alcohol dehydrogenase family)